MSTISWHELMQDPTAYLGRLAAGESFVVLSEGRAVAEMRPLAAPSPSPRPIGLCEGAFVVPDDFDEPLPEEVIREFEGK